MKQFIVILLFTIYFIMPFTTLAATPTASPSSTLQTKLKALQDEIASKAAQIKSDVAKRLQNRAYVGTLKSKDGDNLSIETLSGERKIKITQDTVFSDLSGVKTKKKFTKDSLEIDSYLAALGDLDDTQTLVAKKIVKHAIPIQANQQIESFWGKILSSTPSTLTIETKDGKTQDFLVSKETVFKYQADSLIQLSDLKPGFIVSVVSSNPSEAKPKARFIYVYSTISDLKAKPASPSATPKLSPTKTPAKKATPTPKV